MSDYFTQLRNKRELIKLRESSVEDWRAEILSEEGDHPFVEVMPKGTDEELPKKSKKKDKEEKKEEEVKEGYKSMDLDKQDVAARKATDAARKSAASGDTEGMKRHLARRDAIKSPSRRQLDLSSSKKAKLRK